MGARVGARVRVGAGGCGWVRAGGCGWGPCLGLG